MFAGIIESKQSGVIVKANLEGVLPLPGMPGQVCPRIKMFSCLFKSLEQGEFRVISAPAISQYNDQTK